MKQKLSLGADSHVSLPKQAAQDHLDVSHFLEKRASILPHFLPIPMADISNPSQQGCSLKLQEALNHWLELTKKKQQIAPYPHQFIHSFMKLLTHGEKGRTDKGYQRSRHQ